GPPPAGVHARAGIRTQGCVRGNGGRAAAVRSARRSSEGGAARFQVSIHTARRRAARHFPHAFAQLKLRATYVAYVARSFSSASLYVARSFSSASLLVRRQPTERVGHLIDVWHTRLF